MKINIKNSINIFLTLIIINTFKALLTQKSNKIKIITILQKMTIKRY